jgi:preprotein translocase subunit SecE
MSLQARASEFLKEVRIEIPKVSWPSRRELRDSTIVVITMTLIMAGIVAILDTLLVLGLKQLFRVG